MKKTICLILIFILVLLCVSCGEKKDASVASGEISLFAFSPDTLNPLTTKYKTNASLLSSMLYKPLLTVNEDLSITPCLATEWNFSKNGLILKLTLRDDIVFSDGTPLTAIHAKGTLDTLKEYSAGLYSPVNDYVESCSASGNVLTLKLKQKGLGVLSTLNFPIYKDKTSLLGCGSYILTDKTNDKLVLTANTGENANKEFLPQIKTVHVVYYPNKEASANAFHALDIDMVSCDINALSTLSNMTNISTHDYVTDKFTYLGFNCTSTILPDAYARKAIAHLIDKQALVDSMLAGYAAITNSPFRPKSAYDKAYKTDLQFNVEKAKAYLKKSHAEDVPSFSILINEESDSKKKTAEFINTQLRENGIDSKITALPYKEYLEKIEKGEYTAYIGEVIIPADQNLSFLLHSSKNNLNYKVKKMDALLTEFSGTGLQKKKTDSAKEIQALLLKHVPIISLYYEKEVFAVSDKVNGTFSPYANSLYEDISKWSVE